MTKDTQIHADTTPPIRSAALIGLGAMGVFFAPRLAAHLGPERFRVVAGGERRERLLARGVTVNGVRHRFTVVPPEAEGEPADLVILAVKDTQLPGAIRDIHNQVGPETQLLCVMNGIDSEERVAAVYGWERVLYSYMRVSIDMRDGVANYNPALGRVHFGEAKNELPSPRVLRVARFFDACGIPYTVDPDMLRGLWFKFMCNVGENLTCALLGVPFGAFHTSAHANAIRWAAMREVAAVANCLGIDLGEADMERQEETIRRLPFENRPSTLQDLENGRPTEVEMFAGKMVALGEQLGVETPLNRLFYHGIRVLEEKNAGLFTK